jgi:cellulose synthase/poly-beta-1,6-N-acetylglucosamine synthase-like glycosyltransferase
MVVIISFMVILEIRQPNFPSISPSVSIIVPIKGLDISWQENVKSLTQLEYDNIKEIVYVVDSDDLDTYNALESYGCKVIFTEKICENCSGKIRAEITGILHTCGDFIVFVDSDIRVERNWLTELVKPLNESTASTTFSWPKPINTDFRSLIRASFWILGFDLHIFANGFLWGGSMAISRKILINGGIDYLKDKIYDDGSLTTFLKKNKINIKFVNRAICYNIYNGNEDFMQWMSRQISVIRKYAPLTASFFSFNFILFLLSILFGLFNGDFIFIAVPLSWIIKEVLYSLKFHTKSLKIPLLSMLSIMIAFVLLIINFNQKKVKWRGKEYDI